MRNAQLDKAYERLRKSARRMLAGRGSLESCDVVHEGFLKALKGKRKDELSENPAQWAGLIGRVMRQALIDYYRKRNSGKDFRSKPRDPAEVLSVLEAPHRDPAMLIYFEQSLERMSSMAHSNPTRLQAVVDLWLFSDFTLDEISEKLEIPKSTVARDVSFAKRWLHQDYLANEAAVG